MKAYPSFVALCILLVGVQGCYQKSETTVVEGFKPVYLPMEQAKNVSLQQARPTVRPGKTYVFGNTLFQLDDLTGIHVINNQTPSAAAKTGFISVPGCTEMAIRNGIIYTNNHEDLVALEVSSGGQLSVRKRIPNAFPQVLTVLPPTPGSFFECVDPAKGIILRWEPATLTNPKCRR